MPLFIGECLIGSFIYNSISVRVFGSHARFENDHLSDLDILVVFPINLSIKSQMENLSKKLEREGYKNPSFSVYKESRIIEMFKKGHLFAWHLYYESYRIFDKIDLIDKCGRPSNYLNAMDDINFFYSIVDEIFDRIHRNLSNNIYEAGLLYIAIRNIAISASYVLFDRPVFSRYVPIFVSNFSKIDFPVSTDQYNDLMLCRKNGMEGLFVTAPSNLLDLTEKLMLWSRIIKRKMQDKLQ